MTGRLRARWGQNWWIGVAIGAALAIGGLIAVNAATDDANAQGVFTLSVKQLKINQRISSAAVARSNEALKLLAPIRPDAKAPAKVLGWDTAQLRDGAVTAGKLDAAVSERLPRWAVVEATTGRLVRGKGATTSAKLAPVGFYSVTFDRDISACSFQVTAAPADTTTIPVAQVAAWVDSGDPKKVTVRTAADDAAGVPTDSNAVPFHLTVLC